MTLPPSTRPPRGAKPLVTVGVLADTHVPDRVTALHPLVMPTFAAHHVQHILHAGDICARRVLDELAQIAPVTAVGGNRDLFLLHLPQVQEVEFGGVRVALMHGHGGIARYVWDKIQYMLKGYSIMRYLDLAVEALPQAHVVIYGHTHHPELLWYREKLLFNPGSASFGYLRFHPPSIGLLHIYENQQVQAEFILLEGYQHINGSWNPVKGYSPSLSEPVS